MANEIQRAFNVLSGSIGGAAAVLGKSLQPKEVDSGKVFVDVNKPGLQYTPVYDNESAAAKATSIANEIIKAKGNRAKLVRTSVNVQKVEGGKKE